MPKRDPVLAALGRRVRRRRAEARGHPRSRRAGQIHAHLPPVELLSEQREETSGGGQLLAEGAKDSRKRAFNLMSRKSAFPNPQNRPTRRAKRARNRTVTLRIPGEFSFPKRDARFRRSSVARASVPETTVHKHCDLPPAENEIRLAR